MGRVFAKPTAFVSKPLNASHRKFEGNIILVLRKTYYTNPKQAVDG